MQESRQIITEGIIFMFNKNINTNQTWKLAMRSANVEIQFSG